MKKLFIPFFYLIYVGSSQAGPMTYSYSSGPLPIPDHPGSSFVFPPVTALTLDFNVGNSGVPLRLVPTDWTITDGVSRLSMGDPGWNGTFSIFTDVGGNITTFELWMRLDDIPARRVGEPFQFQMRHNYLLSGVPSGNDWSAVHYCAYAPSGSCVGSQSSATPSTIAPTATAPSPPVLALFGLGVAGLGWSRRKQRL